MRNIRRLTVLGAAVLTALLAACSAPSQDPSTATDVQPVPTVTASGALAPTPAPGAGAATFGSGCSSLPGGDDPGSLGTMRLQPVAGAVGTNPQLSMLNQAISKANLTATLNAAPGLTVFAPSNAAFDKLPANQLTTLLNNPTQLAALLRYHVSGTRASADELRAQGTVPELAGGSVRVSVTGTGAGTSMTVADASGTTARVVCGNITTQNATVFLIDTVLQPQG
ncbi:fasciclin domain-containing protein [Pseudonocardia ailaonensis]|uniref:Fasciclin domain-containing protein n=1 Tax=Pseudonocardia ailaonensis TaxID=367279 RepID=A0ABN2NGE3_9PSEU